MEIMVNRKQIGSIQVSNLVNPMYTQNSAKCRDVFEFSALNVGPKVYTWQRANKILTGNIHSK